MSYFDDNEDRLTGIDFSELERRAMLHLEQQAQRDMRSQTHAERFGYHDLTPSDVRTRRDIITQREAFMRGEYESMKSPVRGIVADRWKPATSAKADKSKLGKYDMDATRGIFNPKQTEKDNMSNLYKYKVKTNDGEVEVYGKRLAIDGMTWVMKSVDTGAITVIGVKEATEVLPYTVGVVFLGDGGNKTYQYVAKEGEVNVGDLIWLDKTSGLAKVVAVDTKSKLATAGLSGWVLSGKPLTTVSVNAD